MLQHTVTADFRFLAIDQLRESPTNPRRSFDQDKLQELAHSVKAQGILVPLIVRNLAAEQFEVIAGARRFRAAQAAELFAVPVQIVDLTDDEALMLQLVENAQREDVHPLEEAFAYRALLNISQPKYDVASIALKVSKSVGHVYGRLRYVDLIESAAQAFLENRLTAGHALLIARLPRSQQAAALGAAFRSIWGSTEKQLVPVRELAQWIRQNLMLQLGDATFDRQDETLLPEAGSCIHCEKRTGSNTALFDAFRTMIAALIPLVMKLRFRRGWKSRRSRIPLWSRFPSGTDRSAISRSSRRANMSRSSPPLTVRNLRSPIR